MLPTIIASRWALVNSVAGSRESTGSHK